MQVLRKIVLRCVAGELLVTTGGCMSVGAGMKGFLLRLSLIAYWLPICETRHLSPLAMIRRLTARTFAQYLITMKAIGCSGTNVRKELYVL